MARRFIAALSVVVIIVLFAFTARLNPIASTSPQELTVISRTRGDEVLTANVLNNQVRITLKNNHIDTITAFAISIGDTTIKEDFAYSEINFGIEPGDTFQKSYSSSPSPGSELPSVYLLTVLLKNGTNDGNFKVAQEMRDSRLGQKTQILRTLKVLEKEELSRQDLNIIKGKIVSALNTGEVETRSILQELTSRSDTKLSDNLRNGLQWGREKMLRRFEAVEQLPTEHREQAYMRFKDQLRKLLEKL